MSILKPPHSPSVAAMTILEARRQGARLIRLFRDGMITNDQFVDLWPGSRDPAMEAIWLALWFTYDDMHRHTMTGDYSLTPDGRAAFTRCALFLESGLPYQWPDQGDPLIGCLFGMAAFAAPLFAICLCSTIVQVVTASVVLWTALAVGFAVIKRRRSQGREARPVPGDLDDAVWPFASRTDYEAALAASPIDNPERP